MYDPPEPPAESSASAGAPLSGARNSPAGAQLDAQHSLDHMQEVLAGVLEPVTDRLAGLDDAPASLQ